MMAYQSIDVAPIAGAIGAEISGVDLSQDLPERTFDEIHKAFLDYKVLCFRNQNLTPEQQVAVSRCFGTPDIYPYIKSLPDVPEVIEILKTERDNVNFGGVWHSDTSYLPNPALGTLLYALETPEQGGDTLFANMQFAYEALSDAMKAMLDGMIGVNSSAQNYTGGRAKVMKELDGMKDKYIDSSEVSIAGHPVVRTHPETGAKGLYISRSHTANFKGMTREESRPLIDFLSDHAVRAEFTCRVQWKPGTMVLWDNRCTQHCAINDYNGQRRRMHRVTLKGEQPA
jgi:taurine dioxygenase